MDGFKSQGEGVLQMIQGGGACVLCAAATCGLTFCIAQIVFVVFIFIYAFANPDNEGWYAVQTTLSTDGKPAFDTQIMAGTEMVDTAANTYSDMDDVHSTFVMWFTWSAINYMLLCGVSIFSTVIATFSPGIASFC